MLVFSFIVGLIVGIFLGIFGLCLATAAKKADVSLSIAAKKADAKY